MINISLKNEINNNQAQPLAIAPIPTMLEAASRHWVCMKDLALSSASRASAAAVESLIMEGQYVMESGLPGEPGSTIIESPEAGS